MSDPFQALRDARRVLEEGLALLDGAAHDDRAIPEAIGRIVASLAATEDPADLRAAVAKDDLERFDDELEDVLRLNVILVSAAKRDREVLVHRLKATREARRDLRHQSSGGSAVAGARCDVSG